VSEHESINSGPGWYEVIHPENATTCIALVYEDGSLYFPEGGQVLTRTEFTFAAARGRAHRLVRADEVFVAPIDWPARFRAAAEVAEAADFPGTARDLERIAEQLRSLGFSWPHVVEAIGRALLGEKS
jgi:hypothetical protein